MFLIGIWSYDLVNSLRGAVRGGISRLPFVVLTDLPGLTGFSDALRLGTLPERGTSSGVTLGVSVDS